MRTRSFAVVRPPSTAPYFVCPSYLGGYAVVLDPRTIAPDSLEPVLVCGRFDTNAEARDAAVQMAAGFTRATVTR